MISNAPFLAHMVFVQLCSYTAFVEPASLFGNISSTADKLVTMRGCSHVANNSFVRFEKQKQKMVQTVDVMECGLERTSTSVFPGAFTVWFCFSRNVCVLRNPWTWSRWWETGGIKGFPGTVLGKGLADGSTSVWGRVPPRKDAASATSSSGNRAKRAAAHDI